MKGAKPQIQTTQLDPQTQAFVQQMRGQALGGQNAYDPYQTAGNLGLSAVTGDPNAINQFMNPYQSQLDPFFAQQRSQAVQGANDQATAAGAFGGDRSGIAAAQAGALADQNAAGYRVGEFNNAIGRAQSLANLGFTIPQARANTLATATGPYGQTTTTPQSQNWGAGLLGAGLSIASLFPGGGLLGGLGHLFGGGGGGQDMWSQGAV